jgi:phosphatidylglycerol:prolipoprotein diacylglycerol transferase
MAVAGMFSLLYGCARFFTEYFRVPDYNVTFGGITISAGQMLSVPMIVLGVVLLIIAYRNPRQYAGAGAAPPVKAAGKSAT